MALALSLLSEVPTGPHAERGAGPANLGLLHLHMSYLYEAYEAGVSKRGINR